MTNEFEKHRKSDEIEQIIERMPNIFTFWISIIVTMLIVLIGTLGWLIRYPDVVTGGIVINSSVAPLRLIARTDGKLKLLNVKSKSEVKSGQIIAYIENPANLDDVLNIHNLIKSFDPSKNNLNETFRSLPNTGSLGELNSAYYTFKNALQEAINFNEDLPIANQKKGLQRLLDEQRNSIVGALKRVTMSKNAMEFMYKFFRRDSILFTKRVLSESEYDQSQLNYNSSKDAYQNTLNNVNTAKQAVQQTISKIVDLAIQDPEKHKQVVLNLIAAHNELLNNITEWEIKYVFRASFDGRVQFLNFYSNNQYIQNGDALFTVIPVQQKLHGEVMLPTKGSGKIIEGQNVLIKLDNYPYLEYGLIKGIVTSISLSTNVSKSETREVENYLVKVDFPNGMTTNYGSHLKLRSEAKGSADIITNDRRLIERLFDNVKYSLER